MAGLKLPVFEKGTVLTQEMLETMKNYMVDMGQLTWSGYSDGIVCGCEVTMTGSMLSVGSGMVLYHENLYFLNRACSISVNAESDWQVLRFRMGNMSRNKNFMIGEMQMELSTDLQEMANCIEICRFRLQPGALLRNKYRDFADMATEYDTVNEIYAQWSSYQQKSISYRMLQEFAKEMRKKPLTNLQDIAFLQQVLNLNGRTMNREAIQFYLATRLQRTYKEMSNMEIYKAFLEVLRSNRGAGPGRPMMQREERRIIVD